MDKKNGVVDKNNNMYKLHQMCMRIGLMVTLLFIFSYLRESVVGDKSITKIITFIVTLVAIDATCIIMTYKINNRQHIKWIVIGMPLFNFILGVFAIKSLISVFAGCVIILISVFYLDRKLAFCTTVGVINTVFVDIWTRVYIYKQNTHTDWTNYMISIAIIVICSYGVNFIIDIINKMQEENEDKLKQQIGYQKELLEAVIHTAEVVDENTLKVRNIVSTFNTSSVTVNEAVNEISSGAM
ncbi:MAG: hypothetical protein J6F30_11855 [Cellulosilyticum sp.]|nr:hypothetical protein [Cellulosilyticum sp.]